MLFVFSTLFVLFGTSFKCSPNESILTTHSLHFKIESTVVVVKWSACSPCTSTIRVRISLTPTFFSVQFVFEKNENKQNEAGVGPFF